MRSAACQCRFAVETYARAGADELETLQELVQGFMADGFRHVRIQLGGYGGAKTAGQAEFHRPFFIEDPFPPEPNKGVLRAIAAGHDCAGRDGRVVPRFSDRQ